MHANVRSRYILEMIVAQVIYWGAVMAANIAARNTNEGLLRTMLMLLPIAPGFAILFVAIRNYRRCDEYIRLRLLEAAAIVAVLISVFTFVYSYLEFTGLPKLSMQWVFNISWIAFLVLSLRLRRNGE